MHPKSILVELLIFFCLALILRWCLAISMPPRYIRSLVCASVGQRGTVVCAKGGKTWVESPHQSPSEGVSVDVESPSYYLRFNNLQL